MLSLLGATVAGAALGLVYFLSVWHTARALSRVRQPALFAVSTLAARLTVLLIGLYALSRYGWPALLAALAGLMAVRLLLVRRLGSSTAP